VDAKAGYIGLDLADEKDKAGKPIGAKIRTVQGDSPLRAKGVKGTVPVVGDVVTRFSLGASTFSMKTYDVYCASDATNALAFWGAGSKCRIRFQHNGKELTWEGDLSGAQGK
jgi:hypothetical protein